MKRLTTATVSKVVQRVRRLALPAAALFVLALMLAVAPARFGPVQAQDGTPPEPVASISVTHNGSSLSVSWDAPARATHYDVTYYNTGNGQNARAAWNRAGTSLNITCDSRPEHQNQNCVNVGAAYTVGVRARNANGGSAWRNSAPASPPVPDRVSAVNVVHDGGSLSVTWDAPARAASYDVTYADTSTMDWKRAAWGRAGAGITISNDVDGNNAIDGGTTYIVGVRAKNAAGESAWTNSAEASLPVPAAVTNIQVTHNGSSLTVSWDAPTGATHYDVTYYNNTDGVNARAAWNRSGVSITINNDVDGNNAIDGGDTYTVGVRAKNAAGAGTWVNSAAASN